MPAHQISSAAQLQNMKCESRKERWPYHMGQFLLGLNWQEVRAGCHPECTTVPLGLSAGASWGRGEQRWTEGVVGFSKVACRLFFGPGKPEKNVPETQTKFLSFDHGVKQLHQVTSKNWVQHLCPVAHWHWQSQKISIFTRSKFNKSPAFPEFEWSAF